jgi:hypothetical protein
VRPALLPGQRYELLQILAILKQMTNLAQKDGTHLLLPRLVEYGFYCKAMRTLAALGDELYPLHRASRKERGTAVVERMFQHQRQDNQDDQNNCP